MSSRHFLVLCNHFWWPLKPKAPPIFTYNRCSALTKARKSLSGLFPFTLVRSSLSTQRCTSGISSISRPPSQLLCLKPLSRSSVQIPAATPVTLSRMSGRSRRPELLPLLHIRNARGAPENKTRCPPFTRAWCLDVTVRRVIIL